MNASDAEVIEKLKVGGIGVILTDTLWGLVARAEDPAAVARVYEIKGRTPTKPLIILIADIEDLVKFEIKLTKEQKEKLEEFWSGDRPTSVILDCPGKQFAYLHRDTQTLAFRRPNQDDLRDILRQTGPLVAPSANPEGYPPAGDLAAARAYFGDQAGFYAASERTPSPSPSRLIRLFPDGRIEIIRP